MQRLNTQDLKLECDLTLQSMAIEWTEHCILFHLLDYGSINIRALRTVFAQVNCANAETHAGTIVRTLRRTLVWYNQNSKSKRLGEIQPFEACTKSEPHREPF